MCVLVLHCDLPKLLVVIKIALLIGDNISNEIEIEMKTEIQHFLALRSLSRFDFDFDDMALDCIHRTIRIISAAIVRHCTGSIGNNISSSRNRMATRCEDSQSDSMLFLV
jgi:hypothetical protein